MVMGSPVDPPELVAATPLAAARLVSRSWRLRRMIALVRIGSADKLLLVSSGP